MKYLVCLVMIGLILVAGCTSCVKNECRKSITPASMNQYSLTIVDVDGVRYEAKDIYVFNQLTIGKANIVTYIEGNPKLLVTVY
jgi:hypothetical protein